MMVYFMRVISVYLIFEDGIKQIGKVKYCLQLFKMNLIFFVFDLNQVNVYYVSIINGQSRVIKIYKIFILVFKDRDKYVSGEFR